jgi:hypothetical protein
LAGLGVDPAVVDPWCLDLDGAGRGGDGAGLGMAVAHHEAVTRLVQLAGQRLHVAGGLGFDGGGQHPPGTLPNDLIQPGGHLRQGVVIGDYCQHRRVLPRRRVTASESRFGQRGRYAAPSNGWSIHRFWL